MTLCKGRGSFQLPLRGDRSTEAAQNREGLCHRGEHTRGESATPSCVDAENGKNPRSQYRQPLLCKHILIFWLCMLSEVMMRLQSFYVRTISPNGYGREDQFLSKSSCKYPCSSSIRRASSDSAGNDTAVSQSKCAVFQQ